MANSRMYRMTEAERLKYVTLLLSGREPEALEYRAACDARSAAQPSAWELARTPKNVPQPL